MTARYPAVLDPFYKAAVVYGNIEYPSIENAIQASKFIDDRTRRCFARMDPAQAAYHGNRRRPSDPDWESRKPHIMMNILLSRSNDPEFRDALLHTSKNIIGSVGASRSDSPNIGLYREVLIHLRAKLQESDKIIVKETEAII